MRDKIEVQTDQPMKFSTKSGPGCMIVLFILIATVCFLLS